MKLLGPGEGIKIPHMGWNRLSIVRPGAGALSTFEVEIRGKRVPATSLIGEGTIDPEAVLQTTLTIESR